MAGAALLFPATVIAAACVVLSGGASAAPPGRVFVVGGDGPRGWSQPTGTDETYNHWASRNRFHIGDFLDFKYAKNDSVVVVSRADYKLCSADKPVQRFDDGADVRFRLDRNGNFYFISGAPGHCKAGQRMTVRVMADHAAKGAAGGDSPAGAPSPDGDGDDEDDSGGSYRTPGYGYSSESPPTPPHGNTSAAAAVSPSRGGGGGGGYHRVAGVAAAALLVLA
uniref:Phytocyanin domain-containing protein n=1 Tax=Oryza meridionalis TaxID=40149 RepID=A0A0E0E0P6_9ORYZ